MHLCCLLVKAKLPGGAPQGKLQTNSCRGAFLTSEAPSGLGVRGCGCGPPEEQDQSKALMGQRRLCQNGLTHSRSKSHLSGETGFGELASPREKLVVRGCWGLWKTMKEWFLEQTRCVSMVAWPGGHTSGEILGETQGLARQTQRSWGRPRKKPE